MKSVYRQIIYTKPQDDGWWDIIQTCGHSAKVLVGSEDPKWKDCSCWFCEQLASPCPAVTKAVSGDALTALVEQAKRDAQAHRDEAAKALLHDNEQSARLHGTLAQVHHWFAVEIEKATALIAAGRSAATTEPCEWTADDEGIYRTACGQDFVSMDGDSPDFIKFCCYCGKPARIVPESEPAPAPLPAPTAGKEPLI